MIEQLDEEMKKSFFLKNDGCTYFGSKECYGGTEEVQDVKMQQRCDVELNGDRDISRSHFMIRYDQGLKGFVIKDVGVTMGITGGTFVKVGKKVKIEQGQLVIAGGQYFVIGYLLDQIVIKN